MKNILMIAGIIVVGTGAYVFLAPKPAELPLNAPVVQDAQNINPTTGAPEGDSAAGMTMPMRAENNAVIVFEQRPGTTVKGTVVLEAPGYLVIHEDKNGEFGAIIGSSKQLPAGETQDVEVTLSRAMRDGESLHAMLHFEKGSNTTFSATEDTPVPSVMGGPIYGIFDVSVDAALNPEIVF